MSSKVRKRLLPELRFSEFQSSGSWIAKPLREVALFVNEKAALKDLKPETYVSTENLLQDFMGMTPSPSRPSAGSATRFKKDDVLISNIRPYLRKVWVANIEGAASNDVLVVRARENVVDEYLQHFLLSDSFIEYVMTGAKGVKMPRGDVDLIKRFIVTAPTKPEEQKKIAECLSCIDHLITSQIEKVKNLRSYKQSLMQHIFPVEGEAMPRLRFPAIGASKVWQEGRIGKLVREVVNPVEMSDAKIYSLVTVRRRYGGVELRGDFKGESIKVKSQFSIKENDFLISNRQIVHCACGVVPKGLKGSIVSNEYSVLAATADCDIKFFWYFSQQPMVSESFLSSSRGIVIEKMLFDLGYWLNRKFQFPDLSEQKRIGNFLASIDNFIDRNVCKLEALRAQKRGLMQGLFPSAVEGEA